MLKDLRRKDVKPVANSRLKNLEGLKRQFDAISKVRKAGLSIDWNRLFRGLDEVVIKTNEITGNQMPKFALIELIFEVIGSIQIERRVGDFPGSKDIENDRPMGPCLAHPPVIAEIVAA